MYLQLPMWKGLQIKVTKSAYRELEQLSMDLFDVAEVLEQGYNCSRSERQKDIHERCLDHGDKTIKVVVGKGVDKTTREEMWIVIHVGEFTRR